MCITHYIPDTVLDTVHYAYDNLLGEMQLLSLCCRSKNKTLKAYNVILDYPDLSILLRRMFLGASAKYNEKCLIQGSEGFIVRLSFRHSQTR